MILGPRWHNVLVAEEGSQLDSAPPKSSQNTEVSGIVQHQHQNSVADSNLHESNDHETGDVSQDVSMTDGEISIRIESIKNLCVERSKDYSIPQLERLYTRVIKGVFETKSKVKVEDLKASILSFLSEFAEDPSRF